MKVWVAYDHVIHYCVDLDSEEVVEVEIPGWMNSFQPLGHVWLYDGADAPLTDEQEDAMIEVLENSQMPEPYWG